MKTTPLYKEFIKMGYQMIGTNNFIIDFKKQIARNLADKYCNDTALFILDDEKDFGHDDIVIRKIKILYDILNEF